MNHHTSNNPDFKPTVLKKHVPVPQKHVVLSLNTKLNNQEEEVGFKPKEFDSKWIQKLITFRVEKKWKQEEFANKLQIPANTYKQIESNKLPYDSKMVQKINNALDRLTRQYPIL